jgi:hypothetical protein
MATFTHKMEEVHLGKGKNGVGEEALGEDGAEELEASLSLPPSHSRSAPWNHWSGAMVVARAVGSGEATAAILPLGLRVEEEHAVVAPGCLAAPPLLASALGGRRSRDQ